MARESAVLLKNDENLLPFSKNPKAIAVIGPNANNLYNQLGDYTPPQRRENGMTVLDGVRSVVSDQTQVIYAEGCGIRDRSREGFARRSRSST